MTRFVWPDPPSQTAFPIARAGYPYILGIAFTTAVLAVLDLTILALLGLITGGFVCWFFRDPDRAIPNIDGAVVSPADGKIIDLRQAENVQYYDGPCQKISIFMSVFNVHVNRIPFAGMIKKIDYTPGKFFSANLDKASADNERNAIFLETDNGQRICFIQIAGLIARRIISGLNVADQVITGQRFGMICFGSRLDVYLPVGTKPAVTVGENVKAGATILGYLP